MPMGMAGQQLYAGAIGAAPMPVMAGGAVVVQQPLVQPMGGAVVMQPGMMGGAVVVQQPMVGVNPMMAQQNVMMAQQNAVLQQEVAMESAMLMGGGMGMGMGHHHHHPRHHHHGMF